MWFERFSVLSARKLQCLDVELFPPFVDIKYDLCDVAEVCLEFLAMCILFQNPVRNGIQIVQTWTHMGEESVCIVLISPEVLHTRETVKDIPCTRRKAVFDGIKLLCEFLYAPGIEDPHHVHF